jgi:energy-coupling factor transporter ATP-binding protein EcfA2
MWLDQVRIGTFKNLRDLCVDFDETSPYTVLVGENGSGKSNLIDALSLIFRNLDLDVEAPFDYELKYECRGSRIEVRAKADQFPTFRIKRHIESEFSDLARKAFMAEDDDGRPIHRPAFVFGYYSGPSDRLAAIFERHRERFYSWIIKSPDQRGKKIADPSSLRRLFYAQTLHGQFALVAFFMESGAIARDDRTFLRDHLQIDGLDSVLFALKEPPWKRKGGDARFWNAVGEVQEFLSRLYDKALLPLRMTRRIPIDLNKKSDCEEPISFPGKR